MTNDDWDSAVNNTVPIDADEPKWDGSDDEPVVDVTDLPEDWHAKDPSTDFWPEALMPNGMTERTINVAHLNSLMSEHFRAHGGKNRGTTFMLLADYGAQSIGQIDPKDYWRLARRIVKDTMRYKHGVKKATG